MQDKGLNKSLHLLGGARFNLCCSELENKIIINVRFCHQSDLFEVDGWTSTWDTSSPSSSIVVEIISISCCRVVIVMSKSISFVFRCFLRIVLLGKKL